MSDNQQVIGKIRVFCEKQGRKQLYRLRFPYNGYLIDRIKQEPRDEREWNGAEKAWDLSTKSLFSVISSYSKDTSQFWFDFGSIEARTKFVEDIRKIKDAEAEKERLILEMEQQNKEAVEFKNYIEDHASEYADRIHEKIKDQYKLYMYQIAGVMFLDKVKNALLAFEMGIGKSLISIAYSEYSKFNKVLVITPNSLKFNYFNEVEKFTYSKAYVVNWKKNFFTAKDSKYIIVNYEFFASSDAKKIQSKFEALGIEEFDAVIADESQKLKNSKSFTYKNIKKIIHEIKPKSKVFLSGTPTPNRAHELYTVLHEISPLAFPTKSQFNEYYCGMTYNQYTGQYDTDLSAARFEELFHKIAPYVYRKRKSDVLELPEKVYQKTIIELDDKQKKQYDMIENGVVIEILGEKQTVKGSNASILAIMTRLRQYTSDLKISIVTDLVESILEGGEKVVILDMYKEPLYKLHEVLGSKSAIHTGDQTVEERSEIVKRFQDPDSDLKIFLGSIQTCNFGLTLTAASRMIIMTLPYSVGEYDQATDRIHRIGTKDTVFILPLIARGTIDEMVFDKIEEKRWEIKKVLDNEDYESKISESVLGDILSQLKAKYAK